MQRVRGEREGGVQRVRGERKRCAEDQGVMRKRWYAGTHKGKVI